MPSRGSNGSSTSSSSSGSSSSSKGAQPSRRQSGPTGRPRELPPGLACLPGGWTHPALYRYVLEHCQLEYGWQEDLAADIKRTVDSFANRAHAQLLSWVAELEPAVHSADNLPAELRAALRGHFAVYVPPPGHCVHLRAGG